jgi:hypothetical protein
MMGSGSCGDEFFDLDLGGATGWRDRENEVQQW